MSHRFQSGIKFASLHLLFSIAVAGLIYVLIFSIWIPRPFAELSQAKGLFLLILVVDIICGPLLTLVVYNPSKPRAELQRDLSLIILLQLAALGYGLHTVTQVRPIWLGFERDHFRMVALMDVQPQRLTEAPEGLQARNWLGPKPIGVRILSGDDPDFLQSVQLSLEGRHSAFRPNHWVPYAEQKSQVLEAARPVDELIGYHQTQSGLDIQPLLQRWGAETSRLRFLPLSTDQPTNWTVLIDAETAAIVGYIPVSGWLD